MLGFRITPMVKNLLILNGGVFLIAVVINFQEVYSFMGLRYFTAPDFQIYQIITHMFMHASFMHLFSNMFSLFMFGAALEHLWGAKRFLVYYLVCGLGAALLHTAVKGYELHTLREAVETYQANPTPYDYEILINKKFGELKQFSGADYYFHDLANRFREEPKNPAVIQATFNATEDLFGYYWNGITVGASGAVFGILLAFGMLFPNMEIMLLFFPIPIKAKYFVAMYAAFELYSGLKVTPGDNVAHFAHLGGMLFGFFMIKYWNKHSNHFY